VRPCLIVACAVFLISMGAQPARAHIRTSAYPNLRTIPSLKYSPAPLIRRYS
jgi:hypothetical protein